MVKQPIRPLIKERFQFTKFAELLEVRRLTLHRWITGERKWPLTKALRAGELLGVSPNELQYVEPKTDTEGA